MQTAHVVFEFVVMVRALHVDRSPLRRAGVIAHDFPPARQFPFPVKSIEN